MSTAVPAAAVLAAHLDRIHGAVRTLPVDAVMKFSNWVAAVTGVDPFSNPDACSAATRALQQNLDALSDRTSHTHDLDHDPCTEDKLELAMRSQVAAAVEVIDLWTRMCVPLKRCALILSASVGTDAGGGAMASPSPDGVALTEFLAEAREHGWLSFQGWVAVEAAPGFAQKRTLVHDALLDVVRRKSPMAYSYLVAQTYVAQQLERVLVQGMPGFPAVQVDSAAVVFADGVRVRFTHTGIAQDHHDTAAAKPLPCKDSGVTARAFVAAPFVATVDHAASAVVAKALTGSEDVAAPATLFLFRLFGALLLSHPSRVMCDRWRFIIVAVGPDPHPVEWFCKTYLQHGLLEHGSSADGDHGGSSGSGSGGGSGGGGGGGSTTATTSSVGVLDNHSPYCVYIRCPSSSLSETQCAGIYQVLTQTQMPIVVRAPYVPQELVQHDVLQLFTIVVDSGASAAAASASSEPPSPSFSAFAAALPHAATVCAAHYNAIPVVQRRTMLTPLAGEGSKAFRPFIKDARPSHLLAEMLLADTRVRLKRNGRATWAAIQKAYAAYLDTQRPNLPRHLLALTVEHVLQAAAVVQSFSSWAGAVGGGFADAVTLENTSAGAIVFKHLFVADPTSFTDAATATSTPM